jgi:outer membrane autotransporter protein
MQFFKPFIEAGISNEWMGKTDVEYSGGDFKSDLSGISYDFTAGIYAPVGDGWTVYGDVIYETGSTYEGIGGNLGVSFRY